MKRIKRKQLKEDELVTTINKLIRFFKRRRNEIAAFGILVLLIVLISAGIRFVGAQKSKKESRLLTQILDLSSELNDKPENVAKLEELAGTGKFSRLAYILLATYWVEREDYDKAEASLKRIPEAQKDVFYYQGQDLLAQIHFKRKEYDKAIEIYKKIEEESPREYSLDVVLFHRAEVHEGKEEIEEALSLYKRVQEEFPQTYYSFEASQKVRELETKK